MKTLEQLQQIRDRMKVCLCNRAMAGEYDMGADPEIKKHSFAAVRVALRATA